jgi:hypothetical protein
MNTEISANNAENENSENGYVLDETESGRVRRRIKVKKKVRVRKKTDPKKKFKKYAETTFWVLVVIGFIFALITMFVELDIKDEKYKKSQKKLPSGKTY